MDLIILLCVYCFLNIYLKQKTSSYKGFPRLLFELSYPKNKFVIFVYLNVFYGLSKIKLHLKFSFWKI